MTLRVAIQVENGKISISLGGKDIEKSASDAVVNEGEVTATGKAKGGDAATEGTETGSGGPGGGVVVVGPIVVPRALGDTGGTKGGDAATEGTETGSGGPGASGVLVIGPIVLGGIHPGGASSTSTAVAVNPPA